MRRRIASLWFEHLPVERLLRHELSNGPFALYAHARNADRLYAVNQAARQMGLSEAMGLSDARALCPKLIARPADPQKDQRFLRILARAAGRFCPWVGVDGSDGLLLDITGSAHLWGGEEGFIREAKRYFRALRLDVKIGIASTIGAAWALSHYCEGISENARASLEELPVEALRLGGDEVVLLKRLGFYRIGQLYGVPRAALARRLGKNLLLRLDQALGEQAEALSPLGPPRVFATRMKFPEPIGFFDDVMEAIHRLLTPLCQKLLDHGCGAYGLKLHLARVDKQAEEMAIRFARPLRHSEKILPLIGEQLQAIDAGFGFDAIRLEAFEIERQGTETIGGYGQSLDDLITRIGNRIGFETIRKIEACDSHLPEQSFAFEANIFTCIYVRSLCTHDQSKRNI